jgi:hypothetical protein
VSVPAKSTALGHLEGFSWTKQNRNGLSYNDLSYSGRKSYHYAQVPMQQRIPAEE